MTNPVSKQSTNPATNPATNSGTSRRDFLKSGGSAIGAAWLTANTSLILAGCKTAQTKLEGQVGYENITSYEAIEFAAVVDQIIPPDETPGASDTGVVYFIDVALGGFMAGAAPGLRQGLDDLQKRTELSDHQNIRFSELSFEQQTVILKELENTDFFGTLHFLTLLGMFCLPKYGGNRDYVGWDLLGFDHQHAWQPPFGYYDAAVHGQSHSPGDDHDHT